MAAHTSGLTPASGTPRHFIVSHAESYMAVRVPSMRSSNNHGLLQCLNKAVATQLAKKKFSPLSYPIGEKVKITQDQNGGIAFERSLLSSLI